MGPSMVAAWSSADLHVVSGKGGTGKTTLAAALALTLASRGKDVLLCEVEGRQGIAQIFDVPPLPYEERLIAQGPDDGGDVYALAIDAESAMTEYLRLYYRMGGRAGKLLERFTAAHPHVPVRVVPALSTDVHDLEGLRRIGALLVGESGERQQQRRNINA